MSLYNKAAKLGKASESAYNLGRRADFARPFELVGGQKVSLRSFVTLVERRRRGFPNSFLIICYPSKNTQEIIKGRNRPQLSTVICVHMYLGDTRERRGLAPPKRRATHTWMDNRILFINSKTRSADPLIEVRIPKALPEY